MRYLLLLLLAACSSDNNSTAINCQGKFVMNTKNIESTAYMDYNCNLNDVYCDYDMMIGQPFADRALVEIRYSNKNPDCIQLGAYDCKVFQDNQSIEIFCGNEFDLNYWWASLESI